MRRSLVALVAVLAVVSGLIVGRATAATPDPCAGIVDPNSTSVTGLQSYKYAACNVADLRAQLAELRQRLAAVESGPGDPSSPTPTGSPSPTASATSTPSSSASPSATTTAQNPGGAESTGSPSVTGSSSGTASPSATPTGTSTPTASSPKPTATPTASGTASPTASSGSTADPGGWPDATNTGVAKCPTLKKVDNGVSVSLNTPGQVYENVELMNEAVIRVLAPNVTIRCVKMNGSGWYGIDNTERATATNITVDQVDITCRDKGQVIGMLLHHAMVTRANVHNCDHMINAGGDQLMIKDSYCHDLTDKPVVHADCIQTLGGATGLLIEHNSLWSRDTSDILIGQEYGDAKDVVINNNRLMSIGTPPPAYLLYLSGTNTAVTNNRFSRRSTYGHCTLNTKNPVVWSGNVWDDDGTPIRGCL